MSKNELMNYETQTLSSLEVAGMVEKRHCDLMRDINRYCKQIKQANEELDNERKIALSENNGTRGELKIALSENNGTRGELKIELSENNGARGERKIALSDFFRESTYKTVQGKELPCYDITKKGCEFIAHKLTGVKGTVFTAQYINRFHDMEQELQKPQPALPDEEAKEIWQLMEKPDSETWFAKNNWKLKIILNRFGWSRKYLYHKILVELSDLHDLQYIEKMYYLSHGHKLKYALDLLDYCHDLAQTATRYINYLLIEED